MLLIRLWHIDLIKNGLLPDSQLISQWRELNSIFKNQPKHILINYVYQCPKEDLYFYTCMVVQEMDLRGYKVKSLDNFYNYFSKGLEFSYDKDKPFHPFKEYHNDRYLIQCYWNLAEKFDRGQQDFSQKQYEKLKKFVKEKINGTSY